MIAPQIPYPFQQWPNTFFLRLVQRYTQFRGKEWIQEYHIKTKGYVKPARQAKVPFRPSRTKSRRVIRLSGSSPVCHSATYGCG